MLIHIEVSETRLSPAELDDGGQVEVAGSPTIRGDTRWSYEVHFPGAEISPSGPNKTRRLSIKS